MTRADGREPTLDTRQAIAFLKAMIPAGPIHLCAISEREPRVIAKTFQENEHGAIRAWLREQQKREANIYFSVNRLKDGIVNRKASKADIKFALQLHADIDVNDRATLERIERFDPPPTRIVFSGGGYQVFWALETPESDLEGVESANAALAAALGGDHCHNIDRIMRVAGTVNYPNEKKRKRGRVPALAYEVENASNSSCKYRLADFRHLSRPRPPQRRSSPTNAPLEIQTVTAQQLPTLVDDSELRANIVDGDVNSRFDSRSEHLWYVTCQLVRHGVKREILAGILSNPDFEISASILDKPDLDRYLKRQVERAFAAVGSSWPDVTKAGTIRATLRNTIVALQRLGLEFSMNEFSGRKLVSNYPVHEGLNEISDDGCVALRKLILDEFGFDPTKDHVREAVYSLCLENTFHPIRNYLDGLKWDGISRLPTWLHTHLGAEDSSLNRAIGEIVLIAAVRRVRQPGVKFDTVLVLEGPQGTGKSTAVRIFAGADNFADQDILACAPKEQMELLEGVWLYELCELAGLSRSETNKVKSFISRCEDSSRMAFGRFKERRPRKCIFIGTTNEEKYLRDKTGNRRFLPVRTGVIDLERLKRDRDQLWAEAAYNESRGKSITLPAELWRVAEGEQNARVEEDPWEEILRNVEGEFVSGRMRILTADILERYLDIPAHQQQNFHMKRIAEIMRKLGWEAESFKIGRNRVARGYSRPLTRREARHIELFGTLERDRSGSRYWR